MERAGQCRQRQTLRRAEHQPCVGMDALGALVPASRRTGCTTPCCLLSSALFNISGKPSSRSAVSQLTAGQGELPGRAGLENKSDLSQKSWYFNVFPLRRLDEIVISQIVVMGTDTHHQPLCSGCSSQSESGHRDLFCGQPVWIT